MGLQIQLVGKLRSGKDTFCEVAQEAYPEIVRLAHADILKEMAVEIVNSVLKCLGFLGLQLSGTLLKNLFSRRILRSFWIDFGTPIMRKYFGDDVWVQVLRKYNAEVFKSGSFIITDTRFDNEATIHAAENVITILIQCEKEILRGRFEGENFEEYYNGRTESLPERLPKMGLQYYEISNNGTLEEFKEKVLDLLGRIKKDSGVQALVSTDV